MLQEIKFSQKKDGRYSRSEATSQKILDAAFRCYKRKSVTSTIMDEIATEAKVSRTTIYRHFLNSEEVLSGLIFREIYLLLGPIGESVETASSFAEFIIETIMTAKEKLARSEIFEIISAEAGLILRFIQINSDTILPIVSRHFRARFNLAKENGELRDGIDFKDFSEWIFHIAAIYLFPISIYPQSKQLSRQLLWRFLTPSIIKPNKALSEELDLDFGVSEFDSKLIE